MGRRRRGAIGQAIGKLPHLISSEQERNYDNRLSNNREGGVDGEKEKEGDREAIGKLPHLISSERERDYEKRLSNNREGGVDGDWEKESDRGSNR